VKYDHGTHACYVLDKCRCNDCRAASAAYNWELSHRIEPAYVSANPAREHLAALNAAGVGNKQVAKAAGIAYSTLGKLVYGHKGRPPSKRIRKATLDAILAVTPAAAADCARVPATRTWELIDAMLAAGVPRVRIAEAIGQRGALQLGRGLIHARHARAIARLHADWQAGRVELDKRDSYGRSVAVAAPTVRRERADVSDLIIELAEIVEARNEQREWRASAACRGRPTYLWFPARGDMETLERGLRICQACVVRAQCRAAHLDERDGVYGGLTGNARRQLRSEDEQRHVSKEQPIRHGTNGGYQAHVRRGDTPVTCVDCLQAHADYHAAYRSGRPGRRAAS